MSDSHDAYRPVPVSDLSHLHVETRGSGPLLVFTHGGGDDASTWEGQAGHFAERGWSTVTWDLRGHGRSAAPALEGYYSRETSLADLESLTAGEPAVLVGHSLGGYLSMAYALRHPGLVRALVLVATGPGFRDPEGRARWNRNVEAAIARFGMPAEAAGILAQHDSWVIDNLGSITVPVLQVADRKSTRLNSSHT